MRKFLLAPVLAGSIALSACAQVSSVPWEFFVPILTSLVKVDGFRSCTKTLGLEVPTIIADPEAYLKALYSDPAKWAIFYKCGKKFVKITF